MFCPNCRSEYRAGFTHCPDCDLDLVDELAPEAEPEPRPANDEVTFFASLVSVYRAPRMQAEIIRSVLAGSGIQAFVRGSGMSGVYPGGVLDDSAVMVRKEEEEAARALLADYA
ncbi:MAG: hypothetical protein QOG54_1078 [Actinomycetota bacterium]|jgi:hypothetical protein|nr:hypothetical protein [Actinomycetota bacterium]